MSLILAIDSASDVCAVAICQPGGTPDIHSAPARLDQSRVLPQLIDAAVAGRRDELSAIAVCLGPGRYSGLRVGLATAFGIALGRGIPLLGASTLALAAWSATKAEVVALHPATRGAFSRQAYAGGHPVGDIEYIDSPEHTTAYVAGELEPGPGTEVIDPIRRVTTLASVAATEPDRLTVVTTLDPVYVRPPVITEPRRSTLSRAAQAPVSQLNEEKP